MLNLPDASEVMVTIRANRSIRRTVERAAGIVVDGRLIVEIDHIQRPVGANPCLDGAEPQVSASHKLSFLPALLLRGGVGDPIRLHEIVADYVDRRLCDEVAAVPAFRPSAALVDRTSGGRRVGADVVDLLVGDLFPIHQWKGFLPRDHSMKAIGSGQFSLRQDMLGQHRVEEDRAARWLGPETLAVGRHAETPSVPTLTGIHLDIRSVGFETDHAGADFHLRFRRISQAFDLST